MASSTEVWIRVCVPTPATTMPKPANTMQTSATANHVVSEKLSTERVTRNELPSATLVRRAS